MSLSRTLLTACTAAILLLAPGCRVDVAGGNDVKVAPYDFTEEYRGGGSKPPFDARQVPPTQTHEECREELTPARGGRNFGAEEQRVPSGEHIITFLLFTGPRTRFTKD